MILDKRLQLSDNQAVTTSAISSVIDLGMGAAPFNTLTDIGNGEPLAVLVTVKEAATAAGAATITFSLESDSTDDLATSATVHHATAAIGKATLALGYQFAIAVPAQKTYERFVGLRYTVGTGPMTAGKYDARFVRVSDLQNSIPYKGAPL